MWGTPNPKKQGSKHTICLPCLSEDPAWGIRFAGLPDPGELIPLK